MLVLSVQPLHPVVLHCTINDDMESVAVLRSQISVRGQFQDGSEDILFTANI